MLIYCHLYFSLLIFDKKETAINLLIRQIIN